MWNSSRKDVKRKSFQRVKQLMEQTKKIFKMRQRLNTFERFHKILKSQEIWLLLRNRWLSENSWTREDGSVLQESSIQRLVESHHLCLVGIIYSQLLELVSTDQYRQKKRLKSLVLLHRILVFLLVHLRAMIHWFFGLVYWTSFLVSKGKQGFR